MSKRSKPSEPNPPAPFNNPFSTLQGRLGELPPGPPPPPKPAPAPASVGAARAVVRLERKGRGGKEATLIEKLDLPRQQLEQWLKELKKGLGCGGALEDDSLVLQGDLRERVRPWLLARGVRKVTIG